MVDFEPFLSLLIIAATVGVAVKYIKLPYTIALVIAGLVIGFAGIDLGIELSADLIFLVFLPPLLFEAAISLDIAHIKETAHITATKCTSTLPCHQLLRSF